MSNARNLARLSPNVNGQLPDTNLSTVSTNKLSGTIAINNLFGGNVIQMLYWENKATTSTTASTYDHFNVSITPKSNNSKFLITADMKASHTASVSLYFGIGINDNFDLSSAGRSFPSSTGSIYMEGYGNSHSANAQIDQYIAHYVYSQTSGNAFNLKIRHYLQGSTMYLNYAYSYDDYARGRPQSTLHVMEILS